MPYFLSMLGSAVLVGCLVQSIREIIGASRWAWLPVVSFALIFIPMGELSLGRWIHSFTGFLSLPFTMLLAWYAAKPLVLPHATDLPTMRRYWWLALIVSGLYFPAALGLSSYDPHVLGWQSEFVWIPIGIAIALLWLGDYCLAGLVVVAMLAWRGNWLDTGNGWSYLLDPIATSFSIFGLTITKLRGWRRPSMDVASSTRQTILAQTELSKAA